MYLYEFLLQENKGYFANFNKQIWVDLTSKL